ncbi:MAG TPA: zf-HC2 domain-containing protein [Gaiellaceae bacterium]|nr:zf-HC2 domain-containing protein [Gaiellaceae bacterium]
MDAAADPCAAARRLSSLALDGELPELDAARLAAHLAGCRECAAFARSISRTAAAVREAPQTRARIATTYFVPLRNPA